MKCAPWFVRISPFVFLFLGGCPSSAQFAVCGNQDWEPTEACEIDQYDADEAAAACIEAGFTGGSATCRDTDCTWDTSTCTGSVNNVNNVNNCTIECDPLDPFAECGEEACYYDQNTSCATCNSPGTINLNDTCLDSWRCAPGLVCLWGVCTRMCDRNDVDACGEGFTCNDSGWPEMWGFCPLKDYPCDFIDGSGCPSENAQEPSDRESCYLWTSDGIYMSGVCMHAGLETVVCLGGSWNECLPGHVCHMNNCVKLCDSTHFCDAGSCNTEFGDFGFCQ